MYSLFLYGLSEHIIKNTYMLTRLEMHGEPLSGVNVAKQIMLHSYHKFCTKVGCGLQVSQLQHPSSDQDPVQAKAMTVILVSPLTVTLTLLQKIFTKQILLSISVTIIFIISINSACIA